jgi:cysteine desulfuration protein SufE
LILLLLSWRPLCLRGKIAVTEMDKPWGIRNMSDTVGAIPARLREIVEDFGWCEGREKLELLLEFSEGMPSLPEWLHDRRDGMEPVPECMTPVFVHAETDDGRMTFYFDVPAESPTVRGYAEILRDGVQGASPEEVIAIPNDFYLQMGLQQVLTHQRMSGISAILAHMKRLAVKALGQGGGAG